MKTLARIKRNLTPSKFELWLESFVLPNWVFRWIFRPIAIIAIFLLGALTQNFVPIVAFEEPKPNFHQAELTAYENWQINTYTCESVDRLQTFMELPEEEQDPAAFLRLARQEQRILATVLDDWNTYPGKNLHRKDWHENAQVVWQRVITFVPLYESRNEPWFKKAYPKIESLPDFKTYINVVMGEDEPDRLSDWMISVKHCVYAPQPPEQTVISVKKADDDAQYCKIYNQFNTLNFDDPAAVNVWANRQSDLVDNRGVASLDWTQLEGSLHSLLGLASDPNLPFANASEWAAANQSAPIAILRNRIEAICG